MLVVVVVVTKSVDLRLGNDREHDWAQRPDQDLCVKTFLIVNNIKNQQSRILNISLWNTDKFGCSDDNKNSWTDELRSTSALGSRSGGNIMET